MYYSKRNSDNSLKDNSELSEFYRKALEQARKSLSEGGIPIGAVLVAKGIIISAGHNRRVQLGNPILHGEMDCLQQAGRQKDYSRMTLYTTLSPCMMCSGSIVQFKIEKVVIGDTLNFEGNIPFLKRHGVQVLVLNDSETINMMREFIEENALLWNEDISEK